jgi:hypothetical protein
MYSAFTVSAALKPIADREHHHRPKPDSHTRPHVVPFVVGGEWTNFGPDDATWAKVNPISDYERVLADHRGQVEAGELSSRLSGSLLENWKSSMFSSFPRKTRETDFLRSKALCRGC